MATRSKALPVALQGPIDILMIDNFDSFTYNLYQSLCLLGRIPTVIRNDLISPAQLSQLSIKCLVVSPGPGHPKTDSGISRDAIKYFAGKVPVLGVCMGLECMVDCFGGEISYAGEIKHGKLSAIRHDDRGIFRSLPQDFQSTRYHSLSASLSTLPETLMISATTVESGVIMGVRHRKLTVEAVQYHPESVLSEHGDTLMKNFLNLQGGTWEENPLSGMLDATLPPFPVESLLTKEAQSEAAKIPSILDKIYSQRLKDVQLAKITPGTTPADLSTMLSMHIAPPLIPLVSRLKSHLLTATTPHPALMAEIKRASPSKGSIAIHATAPQQALLYALSGASLISVLTEPHHFKGLLSDLASARQAVAHLPNRPALLRKDFILDEYQIAEARVHGADTILLIVAMLPLARLQALYAYSLSLGMEPVVEVNNAKEMQVALELGSKVIGVNNRNLHDFEVDMGTTSRLADMVKERNVILCALSGISSREDVKKYAEQGVGAILVGEALMRAKDPRTFIVDLLGLPKEVEETTASTPLVKICGIRTKEEALECAEAGADMLGLMFVPTSKRLVSLNTAKEISAVIRSRRLSDPSNVEPPAEPSPTSASWFTSHAHSLLRSAVRPLLVGVFQNHTLEEINGIVSDVQLDMVQLHGTEPTEWARWVNVPVIKVFGIDEAGVEQKGNATVPSVSDLNRPGYHQYVLLDSIPKGSSTRLSGGSGKVANWKLAREIVDKGEVSVLSGLVTGGLAVEATPPDATTAATSKSTTQIAQAPIPRQPLPIILAGGLTPDNVEQAVQSVKPWAVDVSGGVELEAPGVGKDIEKVKAFVARAKGVKEEEKGAPAS